MATAEDGAVLILAADRRELEGLLARCPRVRRLRWGLDFAAQAELNGRRLLLAANGPGPELAGRALKALLEREPLRIVISAGTCGGLAPELAFGDIFVAGQIRSAVAGRTFETCPLSAPEVCRRGVLLSVDRVILKSEEKAELHRQGAEAVDMEAAAVAEAASRCGLPVAAIRVVLDTAQESFDIDFNAMRGPDGRFSGGILMRAALRHPLAIGTELLRLRRKLGVAAARLGDFLAACRF